MSEHATEARQDAAQAGGDTLYWAGYTVFERTGERPRDADSQANRSAFDELVKDLEGRGVTVRGVYDVSGMRESADLMLWLTGKEPDALQAAIRQLRRQPLLAGTRQSWNAMGVHREAEFTSNHSPAFARGAEAGAWVCVYPFVRSYEWYYLESSKRSHMLRTHGMAAKDFPDVLGSTTSAFALGDYE